MAKEKFPKADAKQEGTGAAGGLGFAFLTFTDAVLESGIKIVLEETQLEEYVKDADLVITGEGRMDGQTAMGKAPVEWLHLQRNTASRYLHLQAQSKEMPENVMNMALMHFSLSCVVWLRWKRQ